MGIKADPRGTAGIARVLKRAKNHYRDMSERKKAEFDKERLTNPFADSRVSFGDKGKRIKKILFGVDMGTAEVMLATELNRLSEKSRLAKGRVEDPRFAVSKSGPIDAIVGHHPIGRALADLGQVMDLQVDVLAADAGISVNVAEGILEPRIGEVTRSLAPINHYQVVDAARLMAMPILNVHTPCDNLGYQLLKKTLATKAHDTVGEVISTLKTIPEFKIGTALGSGPVLFAGKLSNRAGKIVVTEFTGGTDGSKEIYEKMSATGVGTIIGMHMKEEQRQEAQKHHINVVVAGHIASDSIGMNLLADQLEKRGVEVVPCSGFIRVKRTK